ncbi:Pre-mRNA-splicing factor ATP-dependent RNA helicase DEAH10-like protein [Drosera capensis]
MTNPQNSRFNGNNDEYRRKKIEQLRKTLPIAAVEKELVKRVRENDVVIIIGETGSGKTTQLPQYLNDAGFCRDGKVIGVTQPRRVAAVSVAKRVAEECGVQLGQQVGYSIRFDDVTSSSTRIKYMTDGLLLREALLDPMLSRYSVIIVDEAHERTVQTDVLLGLLKKVQKARSQSISLGVHADSKKPNNGTLLEKESKDKAFSFLKPCQGLRPLPLKLIVMSASLDPRTFSEYFGVASAAEIQGRQFPVNVYYGPPQTDYVDAAIVTIFQVHLEDGPGDILVFLTGQEEIETAEVLVQERIRKLPDRNQKLLVYPMFSSLPSEQQMKVFTPAEPGFRKVILATNIAETSVTIPGIKYVIDPGVVKARTYNAHTGMESLVIVPTSKAQAHQRRGRAGREGPGKCFRLYPEYEFEKLCDSTVPEIKRCNLCHAILQLKALGVEDIIGFDFMEKPSRMAIIKSVEQLILLGALTKECKLSYPTGHQMARLPLDPMHSKAIVLASEYNCLEEMLMAVAMLSVESIFYFPRDKKEESNIARQQFSSPEGDHITLINVYRSSKDFLEKTKTCDSKEKALKNLRKWCKENFINNRSLRHAHDIHSQIHGHVEQMGLPVSSCGDDMTQFRRCLAAAFFLNAARNESGVYRYRAKGYDQLVKIHPSSVFSGGKQKQPECIIFNELVKTSECYVRNITRIDPSWLLELAPQYYAEG